MKKCLLIALLAGAVPMSTLAVDEMAPELRIFNSNLEQTKSFNVFDGVFSGGSDVAIADTDGDGEDEIIVVAGRNGGPMVQVWEADGSLVSQFFAYDENIHTGLRVAAGDLNNDGIAEIVTGVEYGGGPHVRVFNAQGEVQFTPGFFAFDSSFRGGVDVEVGDYDGDGKREIAAAAGASGAPHVRLFDRDGNFLGTEFRPFSEDNLGGVSLATVNVFGDDSDELAMAIQGFGESWVKVYQNDGTVLGEFEAFDGVAGVMIGSGDVDQDGNDEILVTPRQAAGPHVKAFEAHGEEVTSWFAYNDDFRGGVRVAAGDLNGNGNDQFVTMPGKNRSNGRADLVRYIETDISDQVTRVYEYGEMIREFKVSTGIDKYPTELGTYSVLQKIYNKDYKWDYGEDHPDNYDLKDVKWNLRYNGPFYLHYAYWHNNFGNKMSHGCTNIDGTNAEWIYNWARVGDVVINQE